MTELVFDFLVGIGILLMVTNVIRYTKFMRKMKRVFSALQKLQILGVIGNILLVCFLVGYIVVFFSPVMHQIVVAGILSGGSIYVSIILTILFQMVDRIWHQLNFDAVTDLPNRRSLDMEDLHENIQSVAIIDINDFKFINEKYGHICGDFVLRTVASRLQKHPEYHSSRIGADEFLLQFEMNIARHPEVGSRIHRELGEPMDYNGSRILITCSIGCSTRRSKETLEELVTEADLAMYRAKQEKNRSFWVHYSDELRASIDSRRKITEDIDRAIKRESFDIVFQPQINSADQSLYGFEVLCRFKDDLYTPGEFIPVAEETEQIIPIDRIVTEKALKKIKEWKDAGYELPVFSINYSAVQLKDSGYCDFLEDSLRRYRIPADRIALEITESIPLGSDRVVEEFFRRTEEIGIGLALDDFGTGYSSLSAMMEYPVHYVKLDKSVSDRYLSNETQNIIRHVIHLAHDLGKKLVAEGVETEEQLMMLVEMGIDQIQGYFFSKPLRAEEAQMWMTVAENK